MSTQLSEEIQMSDSKSNIEEGFRLLTNAIVAQVKAPYQAVVVPSLREQLEELIRPGNCVGLRTESGSHYELSVYFAPAKSRLVKIMPDARGTIEQKAEGEIAVAHDRGRQVYGLIITESGGRRYTTSAIKKVWLSYDAVNNQSYVEPE
jgi:hypothetical protein